MSMCVNSVLFCIILNLIFFLCLDSSEDTDVYPECLVPDTKYVVQYGTTQKDSVLGTKSRSITVIRQGVSSELDFYREGRPIYGGVWVIDHSDNDREKFFFHSIFINIEPQWL